ncbi:hypothetical protein KXD40_008662 [Peronospora effusa]|uniref:Uncharacterized protein n=1 Tax=Peronospora effusa TaxID=542832 RepID=A0A3M6VGI8_9STRA|nr:hypothetical protein DD238_008057 [Peronospora effusa]RQM09997.1 hypothetical protein DD237_007965 [Peronospora effusa]UIZ21844.1 hypothetical protein KXD40_008662 [Peronospora effusa]
MESWSKELAVGLSMNIAVVAFCWISGWRPVGTRNSNRLRDTHRHDEESNNEEEPTALWRGGIETSAGLVVAVAVMMAVSVEIALERGRHYVSARS